MTGRFQFRVTHMFARMSNDIFSALPFRYVMEVDIYVYNHVTYIFVYRVPVSEPGAPTRNWHKDVGRSVR